MPARRRAARPAWLGRRSSKTVVTKLYLSAQERKDLADLARAEHVSLTGAYRLVRALARREMDVVKISGHLQNITNMVAIARPHLVGSGHAELELRRIQNEVISIRALMPRLLPLLAPPPAPSA